MHFQEIKMTNTSNKQPNKPEQRDDFIWNISWAPFIRTERQSSFMENLKAYASRSILENSFQALRFIERCNFMYRRCLRYNDLLITVNRKILPKREISRSSIMRNVISWIRKRGGFRFDTNTTKKFTGAWIIQNLMFLIN